jgi:hypothetical protein
LAFCAILALARMTAVHENGELSPATPPVEAMPGELKICVFELDEIERRQDEILRQLDALNERILAVLAENGVKVPVVPPAMRPSKAA